MFIFNVFDTFGRVLAGCLVGKVTANALLIMTVLKAATVVPFVLAKHGLVGDIVVVVNMMILSLANGTFCTLGMIYGQRDVEAHEKEVAGFTMSLFLQAGIAAGAFIAYGVQQL